MDYEIRLLSSSEIYEDLGGDNEHQFMPLFQSHNHWKKLFRHMRGKKQSVQLWISRSVEIDEYFELEKKPKREIHGSNHGGKLWRPGDPRIFDGPRRRKHKTENTYPLP